MFRKPAKPAIELNATIWPLFWLIIPGRKAWISWKCSWFCFLVNQSANIFRHRHLTHKWANTLISNVLRISASVCWRIFLAGIMPALLTNIDTTPTSFSIFFWSSEHFSLLVTSQLKKETNPMRKTNYLEFPKTYTYGWARPPLARISFTVSLFDRSSMSTQITIAPHLEYCNDNCFPMPCPLPVTCLWRFIQILECIDFRIVN